MKVPSICIVSHNGYGAISGGRCGFIGGVEWQTSLLARWLAARGHAVSFVTWDEGGPPEEMIDGVRVLKVCRQNAGLPGLRFLHPKWTRLARALRRANAEVYYHNCGDCVTGQTALWCRRNGRPFVFYLSSNADCDPRLPELKAFRERWLYKIGLRSADQVLVQTATQQAALETNFGVTAGLLPMPCPGPSAAEFVAPDPAANRVLWVGRVAAVKRPELYLELAARSPQVKFDLAGPLGEDAVGRAVSERGRTLANLKLHGQVPKSALPALYRRAAVLCCTSAYEGFPNTFLEAWSHGLPIVSTFDPDGLIASRKLGLVARDADELPALLQRLLSSPEEYRAMSQHARDYYLANHTVEAVLPKVEEVFRAAIRRRRVKGAPSSSEALQDSRP